MRLTYGLEFEALTVAINRRDTIIRGRIVKCPKWKAAQEELTLRLREQHRGRAVMVGPVEVWIAFTTAKQSKHGTAFGDVDAPLKAILDAMVGAGILADDVQIASLHVEKSPLEQGRTHEIILRVNPFTEIPF